MIATIDAIAEKKKFSDHMETTLQRSLSWDRTFYISASIVATIAGGWFHMIAMMLKSFFFLRIAAITAMVAIIWEKGFNLIMAYFKRKDCLKRNLYLNCVSSWKSLEG